MQINKKKQIGYSDMRMHGLIMIAMIIVLVLAPLLGMLAAVCMVVIFGLFFAIKIAQFQSHDVRSKLKFQLEMDRIYNCSKDAEHLKKQIELCEKRAKPVVSEQCVKKEIFEESENLRAKNNARLVLVSGN